MNLRVKRRIGIAIEPYLADLADLRIAVFREWPYLYDGSNEYEEKYLQCCLNDQAVIAIAFDEACVARASVNAFSLSVRRVQSSWASTGPRDLGPT